MFPPDQQGDAQTLLETQCADNLPFCEQSDMFALERLRFALLKLACGSLDRLQREVDQTKLDWRDTLMAAGFGRDVKAHEQWLPESPRA